MKAEKGKMDSSEKQELALGALNEFLTIRDAKGRTALTVGLIVTVYFENPSSQRVRQAVADIADRYIAEFHKELVWTQQPKTGRVHSIRKNRVPLPGAWIPQLSEGESWSLGFYGGEDIDGASPFLVGGLGDPYRKDVLGYVHIHLPMRWHADYPGEFPSYVLDLCQRIRPVSGYAGVGFQLPRTYEGQIKSEFLIAPLAKRFPGVEVDEPIETMHCIEKGGIKGVNWLTILDDRYLPEVGGLDYLRMRLPENAFPFYKYDGGLIIQAGPWPQIGDTMKNLWPEHYVTLTKVLKKIQIKEHYGIIQKKRGAMDNDAMKEWIFRFDGK
ncbi:MAG TPA: DUF3396 domain-containing protein [Polyangium sp.]|nr:DUF3396 domain-containing protein [Polyangium sp.]